MTNDDATLAGFRTRLLALTAERFEGKYTVLARRAGVPVSSLQHCLHTARLLPGGNQLLRLADALGVTVDYLAAGRETIRPADLLSHPTLVVPAQGIGAVPAEGAQVAVPVFRCGCPGPCPLGAVLPQPTAAHSRLILPVELVGIPAYHRLIAVHVGRELQGSDWPNGSRVVVDWDARAPQWGPIYLVFLDGRCQFVRVTAEDDGHVVLACAPNASPVWSQQSRILGKAVAALMPLS